MMGKLIALSGVSFIVPRPLSMVIGIGISSISSVIVSMEITPTFARFSIVSEVLDSGSFVIGALVPWVGFPPPCRRRRTVRCGRLPLWCPGTSTHLAGGWFCLTTVVAWPRGPGPFPYHTFLRERDYSSTKGRLGPRWPGLASNRCIQSGARHRVSWRGLTLRREGSLSREAGYFPLPQLYCHPHPWWTIFQGCQSN